MRYLKITLSGAALFLIYLWITVMLNSCNGNKPDVQSNSEEIELLEEEVTGSDFTEFEGDGDVTTDDSGTTAESGQEEEYREDDSYEAGDYTAKEKTSLTPRTKREVKNTAPTPKENVKTFSSSSNSASAGNTAGDYMVVAGSYLLEENANRMVKKLKGMGYSNAEIVYFNQSQYHSICAGRYNSSSTASQTSSELRNAGIDSYVHKRQ